MTVGETMLPVIDVCSACGEPFAKGGPSVDFGNGLRMCEAACAQHVDEGAEWIVAAHLEHALQLSREAVAQLERSLSDCRAVSVSRDREYERENRKLKRQRDEARSAAEDHGAKLVRALDERDEARAEVERLREERDDALTAVQGARMERDRKSELLELRRQQWLDVYHAAGFADPEVEGVTHDGLMERLLSMQAPAGGLAASVDEEALVDELTRELRQESLAVGGGSSKRYALRALRFLRERAQPAAPATLPPLSDEERERWTRALWDQAESEHSSNEALAVAAHRLASEWLAGGAKAGGK